MTQDVTRLLVQEVKRPVDNTMMATRGDMTLGSEVTGRSPWHSGIHIRLIQCNNLYVFFFYYLVIPTLKRFK